MAKIIKIMALMTTLITILCAGLYICIKSDVVFTLMITFGTTSYHLVMRLLVGFVVNLFLHNRVNYHRRWFQVSYTEHKIYKKLNAKKWKGKMPTFEPSLFDTKLHSWDEIAQAMCQAELVHEVIIVLSFVPIFAAIPFGALWVFIITSVLAAGFDAMFVILQRYNRPRIIKLIKNYDMTL